jgi:3-methyladenine DNA glycosylase/8-oxoguanine DNA glycosylase
MVRQEGQVSLLPASMIVRLLTHRGGAYLTPAEMDVLTEGWQPYRSLGVYYTWAIADGGTA